MILQSTTSAGARRAMISALKEDVEGADISTFRVIAYAAFFVMLFPAVGYGWQHELGWPLWAVPFVAFGAIWVAGIAIKMLESSKAKEESNTERRCEEQDDEILFIWYQSLLQRKQTETLVQTILAAASLISCAILYAAHH